MTFFFSRLNEIRETASNKQSAIVIGKRQDARSKQPHHLRTFKRIILDRGCITRGTSWRMIDPALPIHTDSYICIYIHDKKQGRGQIRLARDANDGICEETRVFYRDKRWIVQRFRQRNCSCNLRHVQPLRPIAFCGGNVRQYEI